ncbi:MAG: GIY-YIG nuclease family protein [Chloroflexi bacterium]|nr:GIY-YIG nuclease family protein [Chloroflexota bacterium]
MIILPAIPAIVAALTPLVKAALVSAGIGAVVGSSACAVGGAVSGFHEHGELNRDVALGAVQSIPKCAAEGAIISAVIAPAGIIFAPAVVAPGIAPVIQVVDDVARPVVQVVDDVARGVGNAADDVGVQFGVAAHSSRMSIEKVVTTSLRNVRKGLPPPIQRLLPKTTRSSGYVYVFDDAASGTHKIGRSINPKRRLGEVKGPSGAKPKIVCTIPTYNMNALESALHTAHASQRLPNTGAGTEWFDLKPAQVKAICG